jgi:hypothetical protein
VIGNPVVSRGDRTPERWFDGKAFLNPAQMPAGRFGDGGRNSLLGPGFHNWDLSLLKSFLLGERARMQFRFESFNTFNHPNFTGINTTVRFDAAGNPTSGFGAVNAAGPGRVLSLGLKLLF